MGLTMSPGSVISQLDSMNENLVQAVSNAETMLLNVNDFLDTGDSLVGKSYDSARSYFGAVHVPVLNAMIKYAENMIQENDAYKGHIASHLAGIGYVDEDELKKDKEFLIEKINHAYNLMAVSKASVSSYISSLEHAKSLVEKKLKQIEDFKGATAGLYQSLDFSNQDSNQNLMLAINTINNPSIGYAERSITVKLLLGDASIEEFETMLNEYRAGGTGVTYEDVCEYLNELKDHYFITPSDYSSILNKIDALNYVPSDVGAKYMSDINSLLSERKPLAEKLRGKLASVLSINPQDDPSALVEYKLLRSCSSEILEGKISITEIQIVVDILQRKNPETFDNIGILYVHSSSDCDTVINNIIKPYTTLVSYVNEDVFSALDWDMKAARDSLGDGFLVELRLKMLDADITSEMSVISFLATITHECGGGSKLLEIMNDNSSYDKAASGAGIIQVTGPTQRSYLKYLERITEDEEEKAIISALISGYDESGYHWDKDDMEGLTPAKYIADKHPIDSAIWCWGINNIFESCEGNTTINEFINDHESCDDKERLFLVSQYDINSRKFAPSTLHNICHNYDKPCEYGYYSYEDDNGNITYGMGFLYDDSVKAPEPVNWPDRLENFHILEEYY